MPDPKKYKTQEEWMDACMPQVHTVEGKSQKQSVVVCSALWRGKDKKKTEKMADEVPMADYLRDLATSIIYKYSDEPKDGAEEVATGPNKKGFFDKDITKTTINNENFRKVLYTGEKSQLVLMSLKPGEDIGDEVHDVDQFFRLEQGSGEAIINGNIYKIKDDSSIVVPVGAKHNFINTGKEVMKLYSIYSPPHHEDGVVHKTKEEAISDDEDFDGKTSE